jgi:hypothetical protein
MRVNTKSAKGKPESMPVSTFAAVLRFLSSLIGARLDGSYRRTPFFDPNQGTPVTPPKILSSIELERVMSAV